jgi:hypothetical protein
MVRWTYRFPFRVGRIGLLGSFTYIQLNRRFFVKTLTMFVLTLSLMVCNTTPLEQNARSAAAGLNGALSAAQTQYQTQCVANPKLSPCVTINKAIDGQNALVTAVEAYCGWNPLSPPANPTTVACAPVKGAAAGLTAATANANLFITELKGIIQ